MNVYDFDNTIYEGDSTIDFFKYCIKKKPSLIIYFPRQVFYGALYILKIVEKEKFKEQFYSYFNGIDFIDEFASGFWNANQKKIKKWYFDKHKASDVIVSASPEFLLQGICKRLDVRLIASKVNKLNGKLESPNCYGEEKVRRFRQVFDETSVIDDFYSDSESDYPMANISKRAFLVNGEKITEWRRDSKI